MFRFKNLLWITFAFCVTTGSCTVFYAKVGDEIKMDCPGADPKSDIEWKLNNAMLFYMSKTGRQRKGSTDTSQRTRMEGNMLKISPLKSIDSGVVTCKSSTHTLYVASAHANPSSVLHSGETKLSCDVSGDSKSTFHWLTPKDKPYAQEKVVTVKHVTADHAGLWTCQIKNEKQEILIKLNVYINVVGPLITSENVRISESDNAELPCFLPAVSRLYITKGSWTHDSPSGVQLPTLMRTGSGLRWNRTGVNTKKVGFTDQDLREDFNLTLKTVNIIDAGVYVCTLVFDGGKSLSAHLKLTVNKKNGSASDSQGSTNTPKMLHKPILGVQLWIWITGSVLFVVLVVLVVISLLIYRRNKRMKRKMRKLSKRQPRNYCVCNRRQTGKSPGKKERPPPLPRHQYSSLNE